MNKYINKNLIIALLVSSSGLNGFGQKKVLADEAWKDYLNLDQYLVPFWKTDTVYAEVIQAIAEEGNSADARLLYDAKKIVSVKAAALNKTYVVKKDWIYKAGRIIIPEHSAAPVFMSSELLFGVEKKGTSLPGKKQNEFVLHNERGLFHSRQLVVTYIKKRNATWRGPVPEYSEKILPHAIGKLKQGANLKIVFYGNSIETGANSSGFINVAPFLPTWPEMIIHQLRRKYGNNITYQNKSVGGKLASWGKEMCSELVNPENPDLVIIGFGMNDGTQGISADDYATNIRSIVGQVKSQNNNCEFILISPMLANPYAKQNRNQALYKHELYKFKSQGIAIADMTTVHEELLKHKSYQDMTGNNINHPNDYLARWYAMMICGLLIP